MSSENANRPEFAVRRKETTFTGCVVDNLPITILELYREAKWFGQKKLVESRVLTLIQPLFLCPMFFFPPL